MGQSQELSAERDGPPDGDGRNFHGQTRTNDTHASKTDPDARLYRKSLQSEARLVYLEHVLMENRHGLIVDGMATTADGHAERDAALLMLRKHARPSGSRTLGADKLFDTRDFVDVTRQLGYTPHVSQNVTRTGGSAIDRRYDAASELRRQPSLSASHRTGLRLAEAAGRSSEGQAPRARQGSTASSSSRARPSTCDDCRDSSRWRPRPHKAPVDRATAD